MKKLFLIMFILLIDQECLPNNPRLKNQGMSGTIQGTLLDKETKTPLKGGNIIIVHTTLGAATDHEGKFIISNVPVGNHTLKLNYIGYRSILKTDVIVKSQRITYIQGELEMVALETESVTIHTGYFTKSVEEPVSTIDFSYEEIRRAPGSAGDVSRILLSLPSVAKVNDQSNNLIVRGGNPIENTFFIDNIEIPNINHFPTQGSSGGPIGLINVDLIQDVTFHTGGFSVLYGDRLSSIMDITFREGNRAEFDGQIDLNFAGFGTVLEGPLGQKGSYLLSARRSYLDFVVKIFNVGSTVAPSYGDYQGKLTGDINPNHKLIFLAIFGDDHNTPDRKIGEENDMTHYGNQDIYENTMGLNWRALWNKNGYSNTSIGYTSSKFLEDFYETNTGLYTTKNRSHEQIIKFRNINHFRLSQWMSVDFGIESKSLIFDYNNWYAETTDDFGSLVPALTLEEKVSAFKTGSFINLIIKPFNRLTTTWGLRNDYFSYNENINLAPRVSFSYQVTPQTSISALTGIYYQNLPLLLLSQDVENKSLKDPLAIHIVLGIDHLLTENTRFTVELYQKRYKHLPLDPQQPHDFVIDGSFYSQHGSLNNLGQALSYGIELTVQKKLAKDFYGLISGSWFRSRYKDGNDLWRNRCFDNRYNFSIEGGYKPNRNWEFSMRWIYAGGTPYTPMDIEASKLVQRPVYDSNRINVSRYPDYHSMNVRFDRRFHFTQTNLIFYLSAWNVYNRKNIAEYFWNDKKQKPDTIYQWLLLPIFGLEYEF